MKEQILRLKDLREKKDKLSALKEEANKKYLADNKDLFSEIDILKEQMIKTETEIREMALMEYKETGKKKLEYGVEIKIFKKLEYEEAEALKWAKDHNMALSLDKRAFDKIAKADPMDFIKINEIPQATLPSVIEVKDDAKS